MELHRLWFHNGGVSAAVLLAALVYAVAVVALAGALPCGAIQPGLSHE
jgi:hypothetical protein